MWDFIFNSLWGWLGISGLIVAGCIAVAIIFPTFRVHALAVAGAVLAAATIYTKGNRDRAALEARRKEEAVRKAREAYDAIDRRPDTPESATRRMRNGDF